MENLDTSYSLHNKRVVLSVGRLVQRKGFDRTLEAFAQVAPDHKNTNYAIVGEGPYKDDLLHIAKTLGIENRVQFTGSIDNKELAQWYLRCELFLMPSRELDNNDVEGFGTVFLEANSFGKPVIGGKSGGISDAVVDGETGYLVDPTDVTMIATAMNRLLNEESTAIQLGHQGFKRVQDIFQWKQQAKKIKDILS